MASDSAKITKQDLILLAIAMQEEKNHRNHKDLKYI